MSNPFERLWKDRMDIYRYEEQTINHVTKTVKGLKYSAVKCHYSGGSLNDTGTDGAPTMVNSHTIFCGPDMDLMEGDYIEVTQRNGHVIKLTVGEGFQFSNHKEFSVKRDDTV